jgi:hypothetical protein
LGKKPPPETLLGKKPPWAIMYHHVCTDIITKLGIWVFIKKVVKR